MYLPVAARCSKLSKVKSSPASQLSAEKNNKIKLQNPVPAACVAA